MPIAVTVTEQVPQAEPSFGTRLWSALRIYALAVFGSMFCMGLYLDAAHGMGRLPVEIEHLLALFAVASLDLGSLIRDRLRDRLRKHPDRID